MAIPSPKKKKTAEYSAVFFENDLRDPEKTGLESERSGLRLGSRLFQGTRVGLDEVAHRTNNHVTESDIGLICNSLKSALSLLAGGILHVQVVVDMAIITDAVFIEFNIGNRFVV